MMLVRCDRSVCPHLGTSGERCVEQEMDVGLYPQCDSVPVWVCRMQLEDLSATCGQMGSGCRSRCITACDCGCEPVLGWQLTDRGRCVGLWLCTIGGSLLWLCSVL